MAINKTLLASAVLAVACASSALQAQTHLDMAAQGPGVCQAALPSYEGEIRKRPLAIQNEGTAPAFVTCAIPQFTHPGLNDPDYGVNIRLINHGAESATVNCTGVSLGEEGIAYIPRSATVPANTGVEAGVSLSWHEFEGNGSGAYTMTSCALPPGTGITFVNSMAGPVAVPVD